MHVRAVNEPKWKKFVYKQHSGTDTTRLLYDENA